METIRGRRSQSFRASVNAYRACNPSTGLLVKLPLSFRALERPRLSYFSSLRSASFEAFAPEEKPADRHARYIELFQTALYTLRIYIYNIYMHRDLVTNLAERDSGVSSEI